MAQKNPIVTITMEDGSIMKAELYPDIAPESVNNFISLIKKHFYDGVIFHRVIQNFRAVIRKEPAAAAPATASKASSSPTVSKTT